MIIGPTKVHTYQDMVALDWIVNTHPVERLATQDIDNI
jgi:hypothetical protein